MERDGTFIGRLTGHMTSSGADVPAGAGHRYYVQSRRLSWKRNAKTCFVFAATPGKEP